jgi:hypothetical protein
VLEAPGALGTSLHIEGKAPPSTKQQLQENSQTNTPIYLVLLSLIYGFTDLGAEVPPISRPVTF